MNKIAMCLLTIIAGHTLVSDNTKPFPVAGFEFLNSHFGDFRLESSQWNYDEPFTRPVSYFPFSASSMEVEKGGSLFQENAEWVSCNELSCALAGMIKEMGDGINERDAYRIANTITQSSRRKGLDPLLIMALIEVESGFSPDALSPAGARGLMQIMPETGMEVAYKIGIEWVQEKTLLDPLENVKLGTWYLGELYRQFGEMKLALIAYNAGPQIVERVMAEGGEFTSPFPEKVENEYFRLKSIYGEMYKKGKKPTKI